jgi:DNA-binding GntR family transcriptional regulator
MAATDPVYLRVLEDLRERIRGGLLPPGARVPSRNAIIAKYGVGETAAKHALQVLATEGLIEARAGSGSYVRKLPPAGYLDHDRLQHPGSPFGLDEAASTCPRGDDPPSTPRRGAGSASQSRAGSARRLSWEHQTTRLIPPPHIARRLGLEPGADWVISTRYLLTADSEPVQLATSYEPERVIAGTAVAVPEQGPLAGRGVIERMASIGIAVDEVIEEVSVRPSLLAESAALGMPAGAPALVIERAHLASGQPVEAGEIVIAADRFRLRYRIPVPGFPGAAPPGSAAPVPMTAS